MVTVFSFIFVLCAILIQANDDSTGCQVDLNIVLDTSSDTVGRFGLMKTLAMRAIDTVCPDQSGGRTALLTLEKDPRIIWRLTDEEGRIKERSQVTLQKLLNSPNNEKCLGRSLKLILQNIMNAYDSQATENKVIFVIMEGQYKCENDDLYVDISRKLSEIGVRIVTLNIGRRNSDQLALITTHKKHNFHIQDEQSSYMAFEAYARSICPEKSELSPSSLPFIPRIVPVKIQGEVDVAIAFDSSNYISDDEFKIMQNLFITYMTSLSPSRSGVRIAPIVFGSSADTLWDLHHQYSYNVEMAEASIRGLHREASPETCLKTAFESAIELFSSRYSRKNSKKFLILISSLSDTCEAPSGSWEFSELLKEAGVTIFVHNIFPKVNPSQLQQLASGGGNSFYTQKPEKMYEQAQKIAKRIEQYIKLEEKPKPEHAFKKTMMQSTTEVTDTSIDASVYLAILIDTSSKISDQDFLKEKEVAIMMAEQLFKSSPNVQSALFSYSSEPKQFYSFTSDGNSQQTYVTNMINTVTKDDAEYSCSSKALQQVLKEDFLRLSDNNAVKTVIIISATTDCCSDGSGLEKITAIKQELNANNIYSLAIGVGSGINVADLKEMTSPSLDYIEIKRTSQIISSITFSLSTLKKVYTSTRVITDIAFEEDVTKVIDNFEEKVVIKPSISTSGGTVDLYYKQFIRKFDVAFLIEKSTAFSKNDFGTIKQSFFGIMEQGLRSNWGFHLAASFYGFSPQRVFLFQSRSSVDVETATQRWNQYEEILDSSGSHSSALEFMQMDTLRVQKENGVPRILIWIATSPNTCENRNKILQMAELIKSTGTYIITIGIQSKVDQETLRIAATDKSLFYYIHISQMQETLGIIAQNILSKTVTSFKYVSIEGSTGITVPTIGVISAKLFVCIILDESEAVSTALFDAAIKAIDSMIRDMSISKDGVRVALVTYSATPRVIWSFRDEASYNYEVAHTKLISIVQTRSPQTCGHKAFLTIWIDVFHTSVVRIDSAKMLILMGVAINNCGQKAHEIVEANHKKDNSFTIFVIALSCDIDLEHYYKIASGRDNVIFLHQITVFKTIITKFLNREITVIGQIAYLKDTRYVISISAQRIEIIREKTTTEVVVDNSKKIIDVVIAVEISYFTDQTKLHDLKDILFQLYTNLHTSKEGIHIALITFGSEVSVVWDFTSIHSFNKDAAVERIVMLESNDGDKTCYNSVFNFINTNIFAGDQPRLNSKKVVVIISESASSCSDDEELKESANKIKLRGFQIYGIGIGSSYSVNQMKLIATTDTHLFSFKSFIELKSMIPNIANTIIKVAITNIKTATDITDKVEGNLVINSKLTEKTIDEIAVVVEEKKTTPTPLPTTTTTKQPEIKPPRPEVAPTPPDITTTTEAPIITGSKSPPPEIITIKTKLPPWLTTTKAPTGSKTNHSTKIDVTITGLNNGKGGNGSVVKNFNPHIVQSFTPNFKFPDTIKVINEGYHRPPVNIRVNLCPEVGMNKIGCVPSVYKSIFTTPISPNLCSYDDIACSLSHEHLKKLACHCSNVAKEKNIPYFAITKRGACIGSRNRDFASQLMPSNICKTFHTNRCVGKRNICLGGAGSIYAYAVDMN